MARRKKHASHENHERWLVSYADFITLLFAFFVVMFASSQTDKNKTQQVSDSVTRGFEESKSYGAIAAVAKVLGGTVGEKGQGNAMMKGPGGVGKGGGDPRSKDVVEFSESMKQLGKDLQQEIESGKLSINLEPRGLVISLRQATFFPSGEDVIDPATYPTVEKLAHALQNTTSPIRLEGHTDSVPIHTARFRSNWELSTARSIAMLVLLTERFHIDVRRLAVVGYADTSPLTFDETPGGRARNRRVDVVLVSRLGIRALPEKKSSKELRIPESGREMKPAAGK